MNDGTPEAWLRSARFLFWRSNSRIRSVSLHFSVALEQPVRYFTSRHSRPNPCFCAYQSRSARRLFSRVSWEIPSLVTPTIRSYLRKRYGDTDLVGPHSEFFIRTRSYIEFPFGELQD